MHDYLRTIMEAAGFIFEGNQKSFMQPERGWELKFVHPKLVEKLRQDGYKVRGKKFYIKLLSDETNSEIGLVNGKLTPLKEDIFSCPPNSHDSFDGSPAWTNRKGDQALDTLLDSIKNYLNLPGGM